MKRRVLVPLALVGTALLGAAGLVAGTAGWTARQSQGRIFTVADAPARDVAIVFGAQVYDSGDPAPFTAARLDRALELYRAGKARVLLVSGNNTPEHNRETSNMKRYLVERGVPAARVVEDEAGNDSYDTCVRARDTFGVTSATLVSQTYHLPRSITACDALGLDAIGVGDDTVRDLDFWPVGVAREYPANVKLLGDVLRRRPPEVVSPRTDAVQLALRS